MKLYIISFLFYGATLYLTGCGDNKKGPSIEELKETTTPIRGIRIGGNTSSSKRPSSNNENPGTGSDDGEQSTNPGGDNDMEDQYYAIVIIGFPNRLYTLEDSKGPDQFVINEKEAPLDLSITCHYISASHIASKGFELIFYNKLNSFNICEGFCTFNNHYVVTTEAKGNLYQKDGQFNLFREVSFSKNPDSFLVVWDTPSLVPLLNGINFPNRPLSRDEIKKLADTFKVHCRRLK